MHDISSTCITLDLKFNSSIITKNLYFNTIRIKATKLVGSCILLQYWSKGLQHYMSVMREYYTHITRSVHTPYKQIHKNACVIMLSRHDIACKITCSCSTETH